MQFLKFLPDALKTMNFPWDQTSGTFSVDVEDIVETSENTATALNILLIEEVRQHKQKTADEQCCLYCSLSQLES